MKPKKIIVTWPAYFKLLRKLIKQVKKDYQPQQIVCIARGGLIPGEMVSRALNVPLAIFFANSYPGTSEQRTQIVFSEHMTSLKSIKKERVLLVDDLADSGTTLEEAKTWLNKKYQVPLSQIRTAVIWQKETSSYSPDYYTQFVPFSGKNQCPWIIQPQENICK